MPVMPMPSHVNGKPVKTGSWTVQEDKLLADWQRKYGNRRVRSAVATLHLSCSVLIGALAGGLRWPRRLMAAQDSSVLSAGGTR